MTNALAIYEQMNALQSAAQALHASGFFGDVKTQAQAMVKVMAGAEIGLPPFASMSGIHIVQGKPVLGANLIATLVKNDPRYDYRVKRSDNEVCILTWYENGKPVGESAFSIQEASAAGLTGKQTWKAYPSDMLFARALTRGARRYAPGIFGGAPVYTPDELGVDTDEDGHVVEGQIVNVTTPAANGNNHAPAADTGPLPDDEQVIKETAAEQYLATVAALLDTDADAVKARMKALGYTGISRYVEQRLDTYRLLRDDRPKSLQADLFGDDNAADRAASLATAQDRS